MPVVRMGNLSREPKLEGPEIDERIYMSSTDQATNKMYMDTKIITR